MKDITQIDIFEFADTESRKVEFVALYKFICSQKDNEFEILLPNHYGVAILDYGYPAYAGELLSVIADSFEYFVPDKGIESAAFFRLTVSDKEKLVDVLHHILKGYTIDEGGKYTKEVLQYIEDVLSGEIECVCPGIYKKMQDRMAEED